MADLRTGGAVENLNATLASVRKVSDEIAAPTSPRASTASRRGPSTAAGNVSAASEDLPALLDSLTTLSTRPRPAARRAGGLGTRVLNTADGLLASEGVAEVPPKLPAALEELRASSSSCARAAR